MASSTPSSAADADDIVTHVVPRAYGDRCVYLKNQRLNFQRYAQASKKANGIPDSSVEMHRQQLEEIKLLLNFLEYNFDMSPEFRKDTQIGVALELAFANPKFHFPEDVKTRYEQLVQKWKAENWGEDAAAADDDDDDDDDDDEAGGSVAPTEETGTAVVKLPAPDHEIWGLNGIMHGVFAIVGKVKNQKLDKRYHQRPANVRGNNGLTPGDWFPSQMVALFRGAHGQSQAGISGDATYGAYSIVVAGTYKDIDDDQGDTIYYSGPGSQTNENKNELAKTIGATHLQCSLALRNVVRVLRAVNKDSAFAPSAGLRYDGLYRVVGKEMPYRRNAKGGLYTRYILQREPGQPSLGTIASASPTAQQLDDYNRIWDLW